MNGVCVLEVYHVNGWHAWANFLRLMLLATADASMLELNSSGHTVRMGCNTLPGPQTTGVCRHPTAASA